jgi:hypothetical protein
VKLFARHEGADEPEPGIRVAQVLDVASNRIREVVDSARGAARGIRAATDSYGDATGVDPNRIDRERIAVELMEALAERAEQLSQDADGLAALLERARERLTPPPPQAVPSPNGDERGSLAKRVTERFDRPAHSERPGRFQARLRQDVPARRLAQPQDVPAGLRLLATQMAIAGSTRQEVEARLRSEFGVVDATSVLAEVFAGPDPERG